MRRALWRTPSPTLLSPSFKARVRWAKSTLTRQVLAHRDAKLVSLDVAAVFNAAKADPDAFVRQTSGLLGVDEVQRVPELVRAMKDAVEEDRRPGRFLITGSANLLELPGTQESLAGRAETVPLYGLSRGEVVGKQEDFGRPSDGR